MIFPPGCALRARYVGFGGARFGESGFGADDGRSFSLTEPPLSVGAREEITDSVLLSSVTGGGLHTS
jgi:hypothetical protein